MKRTFLTDIGSQALFALLVLLSPALSAQTSYPMLMSIDPAAAVVGETTEHTIQSRYTMYGAYEVIVEGQGVTGEVLPTDPPEEGKPTPNLQQLKVRFTVAADAAPGVRDFRLATPNGASTLGQLVIARDPVQIESGDNNQPEQANTISVPATVCGVIEKAEDVDYFRFPVTVGQTLQFHVRCMGLEDRIHDLQQHADPILTLRHENGATLAASDNFFAGDPFLSYTFSDAGEYLLEIRDVRYQGNPYWTYSIEINDRPFAITAFPLAVAPATTTKVEPVGIQIPPGQHCEVSMPEGTAVGPHPLQLSCGQSVLNPVTLLCSDLPLIEEQQGDNQTSPNAQLISVPCGINGRIESEGDVDYYVLEARKGEKFSFEVSARRYQSSLDPHLRLLDEKGRQLQLNDDLRLGKRLYADSWIENWTAPADGRYYLELRDVHLRGDASSVYFLSVTRSEPYFLLWADTDKTELTPGTSGVIFVRIERKNGFDGGVQLAVDGLPAGVSAECGQILPGKGQDGCIVLTAAPDAQLAASNIRITGQAELPDPDGQTRIVEVNAGIYQEIYQPGGGRGHWPANMHTVAVGRPADLLQVELSTYQVNLQPGQSQQIDVKLKRAEGFDKNVTLEVTYKHLNSVYGDSLPEGVTVDTTKSKTLLTAGASEGTITLTAAANAPPVEQAQIVVMANVSINFVMKATYASKAVQVTVSPAPSPAPSKE